MTFGTSPSSERWSREVSTAAPEIEIRIWPDLVFHVLSLIRSVETDASSLHDARYLQWATEHFGIRKQLVTPRRLRQLSALYAQAEKGFFLALFSQLWSDPDGFVNDANRDLRSIEWETPVQAQHATILSRVVPLRLMHLFSQTLLDALTQGYVGIWESTVLPRSRGYSDLFMDAIDGLSSLLPGLKGVHWTLSHPLRRHGRLFRNVNGGLRICVGVADSQLGVSDTHPAMQGCHEYLLSTLPDGIYSPELAATVPGRDGYQTFNQIETAGLILGARIFSVLSAGLHEIVRADQYLRLQPVDFA